MSKPLRVIAIDPGQRVGWATGVIDPVAPALTVKDQGVDSLKDFALRLEDGVEQFDVVVYEQWILFGHMAKKMVGNDMKSSQLIGMIRFICWHHGITPVVQPTTAKKTAVATMPDSVKARIALSTEQHDKDALMHLWFYFFKHYA